MSKTVAIILLAVAAVSAQPRQLKIVVLEGENAVNIIQQKTAVRAVVEVRDQNNLPVPGASVTFAVTGKGGAAVAGSQSVTVATNAAGQASLTGMTPASSGGLQLSVNATYNGISAATTITQTVVATAALAAATATAGATAATTAATTGAAAGGGLGTGAIIGIVGGVAAVGAGVAVAAGGADAGDHYNPCTITASPSVLTVPIEGGTFVVNVTVNNLPCDDPQWTVTNVPSFVTANPLSGSTNGSVTVTVAPYAATATAPTRTGAISIAGVVVQINQPRPISALNP